MYIEGNALILGDSSYLEHHGILGQKWGVRRFQNKDGTRTAAGKKREAESLKSSQEAKNVNSKIHSYINKQLSSEDLDTGKSNYDFASHLIKDPDFEKVIMPVVQDIRQTKAKYGNKEPYEFTGDEHQAYMNDISRIDNKTGELAITIGLAEKGESHKKSTPPEGEYERVDMFRYALARYLDEHSPDGYSDEGDWIYHTSIDDSTPYLAHHGILGQKWGVRRFQNKDGTRTAAGKAREDRRVLKKGHVVSRVHLQKKDKTYDNKKYVSTNDEDHKKWVGYFGNEYAHRWKPIYEQKYELKKDVYVANGKDVAKIISTKLNKEMVERDLKGLETEAKEKGINYNWAESNTEDRYSLLLARQTESGKQIIKELVKAGFGAVEDDHGKNVAKDPVIILNPEKSLKKKGKTVENREYLSAYSQWYTQELLKAFGIQHTSIGGTMHIEGNALIINSSYLSHHGIRGQRWGVRRFQNQDGSLTNAGRKRLGYATKGVTQTVGKAFKAGVKAGSNAVKAVKAHHEKKEAEKLQKKKEKASQSRLGVLANKDLFTDDELRALNQRFKVEDELKMASIQKGVEIAKAVGTIASNAATAAKAYEDITGQSLSPIKRQAAELKKQQDAEDRARKIASEDAEEARKAAQEERNIKKFDQELRKATADADKEEFLAKKTKAQADQEILKALKGARDFDKPDDDDDDDPPKPPNGGGGGSDDGSSWVQKATAGGKNPFEKMIYDNDPEYKAAKDAHDEKVARKERMEYLDKHIAEREQEKQAEKAAKDKALMDMINQSNARTGRGQSQPETPEPTKTPRQDSDALFSQKGSLPIDKDRYRNRKAAEKAKKVKEDVAEDRAKKQDEKAVNQTINDIIEAQRRNTERTRNMDPHAYDRAVAKEYVKEKAKETIDKIPETLGNLNPINRAAKKIANKVEQEGYENTRKAMKQQYEDMAKAQGSDEANYVMYNTRVAGLQGQGYSERQAKQIADSDSPFSSKRNRRSEHAQRVSELETARKNTVKKLDQAEKNAVDDYYKKIYLDAYAPGTDKREALDREYNSTMSKINKLREENQQLYDKGIKDAQKILEHSFSIQNGVLFVDESVALAHHGIKGDKMTHYVENGTLFINAGEPYLEHHGVLGMKWGKHLRAGKGPAYAPASAGGGGGGAPEEDEETKKKIEEAAKKAGMSVDEYRKKFAKEIARMKQDAAGRKEGSHWDLAKADVHGKTENHMPLLENKHKDKNAKEAMINNARLAETKYKAQQAAQEYTRKHTNSQKDIDKWRNAAYLDSSNYLHKELAEARTEKAQQYYKNSVGGKIDRAKLKAGSALREAKAALKEGPSGVADRIYDAAGGKYKKQAASNAKAAREDVQKEQLANRMANQQRAREASEVRKKGGRASRDKGFNTVNGHDVIAEGYRNARKKHQKAASEANAKYEKSLAGRAESASKRARKAGNELSTKAAESKKRLKDIPGELYGSKHRKDFERNARLLEGSTRSAVEIGRDTYKRHGPTSGFGDPTYKATDDAYKRANKQWNKARISGQKYDRSIAKRVDSLARKVSKARKRRKASITRISTTPHRLPKLKHSDDTNAIYTEGTRLVVNSKWG